MKNKSLHIIFLSLLLACCSCEEWCSKRPQVPEDLPQTQDRFYVLCEGLIHLNNGTLAYWDKNQWISKDYFAQQNQRGLGDTPNDIKIYGNKLYLVVNVSSQIEVLDVQSGISLKQIPLFLEDESSKEKRARQPRHIAFHEDKAYITCFDGSVARLDTASLSIDANVRVGRHPEGIAVANGKLYVANSGGLDYPDYDNTISVIDIASFSEIKKIQVADNPYKVYADSQGDIYVNSRGDYGENDYCLQKIDSQNDELVYTFPHLPVLNFILVEDFAYLYDFDFNSKTSAIFVMDMIDDSIVRKKFITDGTELNTPYGISVNPFNGDVFLCDAYNYLSQGDVLCFSPDGTLKYRLKDVGLNPNAVIVW